MHSGGELEIIGVLSKIMVLPNSTTNMASFNLEAILYK